MVNLKGTESSELTNKIPEQWKGTPYEWVALTNSVEWALEQNANKDIAWAKKCGCESTIANNVKHYTKRCPAHALLDDPTAFKRLLWYRRSADLYAEIDCPPAGARVLPKGVDWRDAGLSDDGTWLGLLRPADANNWEGNSSQSQPAADYHDYEYGCD
jgi:hypothetical protein